MSSKSKKSTKKGAAGGGSKKKAKKQRVSLRDQLKASKSGQSIADTEKTTDPVGALNSDWFKNAKEADKWKAKWECMQSLMGFCCGDSFGNAALPEKFDENGKAGDVIALFAKWLNDENHIFTRQHILKLLIPFSNSYSKAHWKKGNKLAEALIVKQWQEKKHGFLPLVTPALIAVYIASGSQLKKWKEYLVQSMDSPQGQVRMSCWDFLAKICILSKQDKALKTRGPKDVELFINDSQIIEQLKNTILNDKEKEVRDSCAKFIYGAKQICNKIAILESAYKEILNDKRASMALDIAADLFNSDKQVLSGGKPLDDTLITQKVEKKQAKQKKKQASSRKNNMRAMIAMAKKQAAESGGGGAIEIAAVGGGKATDAGGNDQGQEEEEEDEEDEDQSEDEEPPKKETPSTPHKKEKESKSKSKRNGGGGKGGGMKALMNKYKKDSKKKPKEAEPVADSEESEEEKEDSESVDSEEEREKERERKKKEREQQRKEREQERERKREERRKERELEKERERERKRKEEDSKKKKKRRGKYSDSESDEDADSESNDSDEDDEEEDNRSRHKNKGKGKARGRNKHNRRNLDESRTDTIDDSQSSAQTSLKTSKTEFLELSEKVNVISQNIETLQSGMNGMERKMTDIAKSNNSKSGMSTKTEEKIMKILAQLQKDVKIMKNDISYIKACWEDAESVPSDD
eukprot:CAMPEP_0197020866 /NCGR_PEP_ID=MMETSP1384-20130603/1723_1 /TAXON_ID=29189 /ORGANISM="Ammonia sp." /LENGTH=692 /DNA_ID=CAMNT_0042448577 /DNA_START=3128 /DNA_END=5206 /DNA_ORIENTATION=+